jgi:hypothetical protein
LGRARTVHDIKPENVLSQPAPGEYLPIPSNKVADLVARIPIKECDLKLTDDDRQRYRLLAELVADYATAGKSELEGSLEFEAGPLVRPVSKSWEFRRSQSPNFHWESINVTASFIAVGSADSTCKDLDAVNAIRERRKFTVPEGGRLLVLHFEVGHMPGAKNMIAFCFEERPGGTLVDWGYEISNMATLGAPGKSAPVSTSGK